MSDSAQKPGFSVTDRRAFDSSGQTKSEAGQAESSPEKPAASAQRQPAASEKPGAAPAPEGRARPLPPADFTTFILSLGSSALIHLGAIEQEPSGGRRQDLPMAKHTIDLLSLLQEKTKSNLTPDEEKLLESLLYDLRLRYVELTKGT